MISLFPVNNRVISECPRSGFHEVGIALRVDERRQTSMPGIYAAGDPAMPFLPSVTLASSQGAMAGIFAQQSMLV